MIVPLNRWIASFVVSALVAGPGQAQTSPQPGPTAPPLPVPKPGDNLVINPTEEECKKGWHPGLKWTKKQFEDFCAQLKISK
jgi:hypothetical protein